MTRTFAPLRRVAALSVAITLFSAPMASAQSPEAPASSAGPTFTVLLNPAAFARLVQPPPADVAPAPVVAGPPRPSLLRQGTAAVAREAQTAPAKAPQQKSWASRNKAVMVWAIVVGAIASIAIWAWREGQ